MHLCAGTYATTKLRLVAPVSLLGGYHCVDWSRAPLAVAALTTILTAQSDDPVLDIAGFSITSETFVEGIDFHGRSGGLQSRGLRVTLGAAPTLRTNRIVAGDATGPSLPSVGLVVGQGAAPTVRGNVIAGGRGEATAATVASIGVLLEGDVGLLTLESNRISGGEALLHGVGSGSVGLYVDPLALAATKLTGAHALRGNFIIAGTGKDDDSSVGDLSVGVFIAGGPKPQTRLEIVDSVIVGGRGDHAVQAPEGRYPSARGIASFNAASLLIDRCRIYAGDVEEAAGNTMGVTVGGEGSVTIRSSLVHGGGALFKTPYPKAVDSVQGGELRILGSTLLSGISASPGQGTSGGIVLRLTKPGPVVLQNNFLLAQADGASTIVLGGACGFAPSSELSSNALAFPSVNQPLLEAVANPPCPSPIDSTLTSLMARFPLAKDNLRIGPAQQEPADIVLGCTAVPNCLSQIFQVYDATSAARSQLIDPTDLTLAPRFPGLCPVAGGGHYEVPSPLDVGGQNRALAKPSIGAIQTAVDACPP